MVFKLNMEPGAYVVPDPADLARLAAADAQIAKIGEAQYIKNSLAEVAKFQGKMEADAREFLSLYWRGHDVKARRHKLTLEPLERWLEANQPLDRWFYVHLIEAAGEAALKLGYSQHKSDIATAKNAAAKAWVLQAWGSRPDKGESKAAFSRTHTALVKKKFNLLITADTIARDWLPKNKT